jgi:hypothetical protein
MAVSAALQSAFESGGYVAEYYAETFNRNGVKTATLEITDGSVESSWMDAIRRTATLTVPLESIGDSGSNFGGLVPESAFAVSKRQFGDGTYGSGLYGFNLEVRAQVMSILKPFQTRLKVYGRFTLNGSSETVLLGVFTISSISFSDSDAGFIANISGWDTSGDIMMRRFIEPVIIGATTNITPALNFILGDYIPDGVSVSIPTITGDTTPALTYLPGDNKSPWEAAREVAMTAKRLITVNREGNIVVETIPNDSTEYPEPAWAISDAKTISKQDSSPDYASVVNQVIVVGESASSEPVVGFAEDYFGPFGTTTTGYIVSREEVSDACSTSAQCVNLANSLLRKWGVLSDSYSAEVALNPDLEPGDVVSVSSVGLGISNSELVVDSITYPLSVGSFMQISCSRAL